MDSGQWNMENRQLFSKTSNWNWRAGCIHHFHNFLYLYYLAEKLRNQLKSFVKTIIASLQENFMRHKQKILKGFPVTGHHWVTWYESTLRSNLFCQQPCHTLRSVWEPFPRVLPIFKMASYSFLSPLFLTHQSAHKVVFALWFQLILEVVQVLFDICRTKSNNNNNAYILTYI